MEHDLLQSMPLSLCHTGAQPAAHAADDSEQSHVAGGAQLGIYETARLLTTCATFGPIT